MLQLTQKEVEADFRRASDLYARYGVDVETSLKKLDAVQISLHCWQADDVGGFEHEGASLQGGGLAVTGNYPGKARNIDELRRDIEKVLSLLPGRQRLNLHASYGDFSGSKADRDAIDVSHFRSWADWAGELKMSLDFNSTLFSHPLAASGFTLSSKDKKIRKFWIEHVKRCREISEYLGKTQGNTCIHNLWIADGAKDIPVDRFGHRKLLKQSLDEIYAVSFEPVYMKDALESKLFGIGSEAFVVGSHEFYLGYALMNKKLICIDNGHFHPTEVVGDKISSIFQYTDEMLLHLTRGLRWDSDHVVVFNEEILLIAQEIVRSAVLDKVYVGLDFFDASINRIGAYVTGTRAAQKAFLYALLEPVELLQQLESENRGFEKLATLEELKSMPFGAVWNYYCLINNVPPAGMYIDEINKYEKEISSKR
ncbi:MAG: L-rhamnose isomerase [Cyclobacteriaceae bacterium]|nr:L-rhamnose isomerase [Cyclobacteriaceae bacterium]